MLYDPETGAFAWSVSPIWKRFPREGRWYPDGVSQLYLLTCGLIAPDDPVAHTIWHAFVKTFPEWQAGVNKDKFPWTSVAVASFMMGRPGQGSGICRLGRSRILAQWPALSVVYPRVRESGYFA